MNNLKYFLASIGSLLISASILIFFSAARIAVGGRYVDDTAEANYSTPVIVGLTIAIYGLALVVAAAFINSLALSKFKKLCIFLACLATLILLRLAAVVGSSACFGITSVECSSDASIAREEVFDDMMRPVSIGLLLGLVVILAGTAVWYKRK